MKNQYFGDINDYRKYGLLRCIQSATDFQTLVAWMLTPDDGSSDGKHTIYLKDPNKWANYDSELYNSIQKYLRQRRTRKVELIEKSTLLPRCNFYSRYIPDKADDRVTWFKHLSKAADKSDLVFLDPDNGLEIKSRPYGRKNSNKFLFWHEVETLWQAGKSLLIYQHFIRQKRPVFIQRRLEELKDRTVGSLVEAFSTPRVLFLMALQTEHHHRHLEITNEVQDSWAGQIYHWDLICNG